MKLALVILLPILALLGIALLIARKDRLPGRDTAADNGAASGDILAGHAGGNRGGPANVPTAPDRPMIPARQPVQVGGETDLGACSTIARVSAREAGDSYSLAVWAAPDRAAPQLDALGPGTEVYMCDSAGGGGWIGIVYPATDGALAACGVAAPIARRGNYAGPCRSGWVAGQSLVPLAG